MEGFLTAVVAGCAAALFGAIATYYFTKKHREEEAAYKENERRAEMLRELRMQAMPVVTNFYFWTKRGREALEVRANTGLLRPTSSWDAFWAEATYGLRRKPPLAVLVEEGLQLDDAIKSIVLRYRGFQGDLDARTRSICGELPEELHDRQAAALNALMDLDFREKYNLGHVSESLREAIEAFESAQTWDYDAVLLEFDVEVASLANARK